MTIPARVPESRSHTSTTFRHRVLTAGIYVIFIVQLLFLIAHIARFYYTDIPAASAIDNWPSGLIFGALVLAWAASMTSLVVTGSAAWVCLTAVLTSIVATSVNAGGGTMDESGRVTTWSTGDPRLVGAIGVCAVVLLVLGWLRRQHGLQSAAN
ncbi:hypothetical protein EH165_09030 [Nakamurella antarctica]|uniref:Uncharacterized protein n=1 Tax=Nakamurella antarctica TaxID=1902245 RepID=A0A3G8ZLQ0_9ACTN|nr:hypothetical protein [Nakamurella antarctica]AZI58259.1 hypothetical protein EH165_09030 [Nakamurella antarctica]